MSGTVYWLWLELVFGIGGKRLWELADKDGDPVELYETVSAQGADGMSAEEKKRAAKYTLSDAQAMLDRARELGQSCVDIGSEDYPDRFREMDEPPAVLFYRGDLGLLKSSAVLHIVGTRTPTRYTESLVRVLCGELALRGFVLSSGFAEGVDTRVIEAALERGGKAVTVYPTSLEGEYPKGSAELKERLAEDGLLISEYPPDSKARMNFQRRNRLAVTLSSAVIIAEASADSKGLDNAVQAEKLGRPVLVVPPHLLYSKQYFGQRDLLRQGCAPVFDGSDVVGTLAERGEISPDSYGLDAVGKDTGTAEKTSVRRKLSVKQDVKAERMPKVSRELSAEERKIFDALSEKGAMLMDELSAASGLSMAEVMTNLTALELEGMVKSLPGKRYTVWK